MDDKRPFLILLALFLFFTCSLAALPIYVYQQVLHLDTYDDTRLVEQEWRRIYSPQLCLFSLQQGQKLRSDATENRVWNRVDNTWDRQPGSYFGRHNEAYYEHRLFTGVTLRTSVFAQNTTPPSTFIVNNRLIIELSPRLCNPFLSRPTNSATFYPTNFL